MTKAPRRAEPKWLAEVRPVRYERHYGDRVVRCFVERPQNAYALLQEAAARNPDGEALVCGSERLTYRAFEDAVARTAAGLRTLGVSQGDRVALLLGNGIAFPVFMFAVLRLGAIAVPISVREQTPGLAYMLNQSAASVVVHDADLDARLPTPDETKDLQHRVAVDAQAPWQHMSILGEIGSQPPAAVTEEDTGIILYTSGTTGRPKGAMLTHLSIAHSVLHYEYCMGLSMGDRAIAAVPLSHVTGVIALIAAMVRAAATLIIMPSFKAAEFLALAEREHMSHSLMVPAMYNLCLLEPRFAARDLSAWRVGAYGGAPMAPATIARFAEQLPGLALMNAYGATETTSPVTLMPPSETSRRSDSVGCAIPCADILVMDEEGCEVPSGAEGEIWLGGPMVVKGYWDNPQATSESFVGGYWRSGDIGSIDPDGYLHVFDRKKDMINRGGYKVYSVEVENALMSHPAVVEAAAVARPCPVLGEQVHAFVVVSDVTVNAGDLRQHCARLLADYKLPDTFTLRHEPLPRNANGKLLKRALRDEVTSANDQRRKV